MKQVNMTMQYTTEWKALTPCSEHALSRLQDATKRNSVTVASHRAHRTVTAAAVHIIDSVDRYTRGSRLGQFRPTVRRGPYVRDMVTCTGTLSFCHVFKVTKD